MNRSRRVFRRRKAEQAPEPTPEDDAVGAEEDLEVSSAVVDERPGLDRTGGPFDISEVDPADGPVARLDLGGLHVPVPDGVELRLEVDEASGQVSAVSVAAGPSAVQLSAFAAPRVEGIWDDVRTEIAASVSAAGGTVDQVTGAFGHEVHAMLQADAGAGGPGGAGLVPARFVGVDGPRWFLRGLFTGPAARDPKAAAVLEGVLRGCVVVRGSDPMAPGDGLPLHVPTDLPDGLAHGGGGGPEQEPGPDRRSLPPPRRGPEITEIR